MKKQLLKTMFLVAACLLTGTSAWAYTETLTGSDETTNKDLVIEKTSFTMLSTYNPSGKSTINSKNCLKVRWKRSDASTGNTNGFALKVNPGYMITKIVAQMSGNAGTVTLEDIKVDGTSYTGDYTKILNASDAAAGDKYTNITLSGITAQNYINFEIDAESAKDQGFVYITATYVKVNQWDFTDSDIWGSITLPTNESNTKNYQYNGVEGTTLNYVTFYSTEAKIVHPSTLTNGIGFSETGSTSNNYVKISVPAGYTATVTANCTSNRNLKVYYNSVLSPAFTDVVQTQEFANTTGASLDLYIYCTQNAGGASNKPWLKKIELKQTFQVTTNYIDEESNIIKTATVENIVAGSTYSTTYDATYYVSNTDPYKYTYVSGAASGVTINAAAEYTVVYHKGDRASYKLNVTQSYGGSSQKIVDDQTVLEGASYTYYYPKFVLVGTTLYEYASSTDPEASDTYWYSTISSMSANRNYTLTYNAKEGVCVYYSEGEDIAGKSGAYTYANWRMAMSNNSSGVFSSDTKLITLGAGNYNVTARANGRADRYVDIAKTSNTLENRIIHAQAANYGKESSADFSLTGSTDIIVNGGYVSSENGHGLDYVYIMKTTESKTITAAGWATYCSPYALDLDNVTGLTDAYIITGGEGGTLAKTSVKGGTVAANTGLLIKGDAGTATIPVVASGTDYAATNKLVGVTSNTNIAANAGYVLMASPSLGFYKNTNAFTVGANTAYLPAGFATDGARSFFSLFEDDATAIEAIKAQNVENGQFFNLAGQRVAQPTKGLYIVNGRKVVVK